MFEGPIAIGRSGRSPPRCAERLRGFQERAQIGRVQHAIGKARRDLGIAVEPSADAACDFLRAPGLERGCLLQAMFAPDAHLQRAGRREASADQDNAEKNGHTHVPRGKPCHTGNGEICGPQGTCGNSSLRHDGGHPQARIALFTIMRKQQQVSLA